MSQNSLPRGQEEARGSICFRRPADVKGLPSRPPEVLFIYVIAGSPGLRTWPRGSPAGHHTKIWSFCLHTRVKKTGGWQDLRLCWKKLAEKPLQICMVRNYPLCEDRLSCINGARPHGHRTSSPPKRRLLARRPLDSHLSPARSNFGCRSPQCKQYSNGSVVAVLLPSLCLWDRLIRFIREHSNVNLQCANILKSDTQKKSHAGLHQPKQCGCGLWQCPAWCVCEPASPARLGSCFVAYGVPTWCYI